MSLLFLLDLGCPTCINLFTLSHIANLTSLLSSLRKILENFVLLIEERSCRASQTKKTQVGVIPVSSAKVKHLVGAYSKKIDGMLNIRDVPLKSLVDEFGDHDLLRESKSGSRSGRSAHPSNHHVSVAESRAVKRGVASSSPIPLEVRLVEARKSRKSFARAKGSSATSTADPKVEKSTSAGDAGLSDLLKMNFLLRKTKGKQHFISFKKEVVADVADQASGAAESVADQVNAEESAD
ncbi:unnamed protein product [Prunus armeniaca]